MIIVEKNAGPKIDYEATGKKVCFDDDLTINLAKRQEDWPVHIDVCYDADNELVIGAAAGRRYVAEIDIPKREYEEHDDPVDASNDDMQPAPSATPIPLDMDKVTLTLWAVK